MHFFVIVADDTESVSYSTDAWSRRKWWIVIHSLSYLLWVLMNMSDYVIMLYIIGDAW